MSKKLIRTGIIISLLILSAITLTCLSAAEYNSQNDNMTLKITVNGTQFNATLIDNPTSRDFITMLPLSIEFKDLYHREKYAPLSRSLNEDTPKINNYEVGLLAYYPPSHDVVIYYAQDNEQIPGGIIELARIEGDNLDVFKGDNLGNITIELS
jgi:hypothetical protein